MDNVTHTLVGLALGELVERALPPEPDPQRARTRRRALLTTGALASNFPDLDLVLTPLLAPPLGYLMHHRGHTHTLLYALPQIALLLGLLWLLWPGARRLFHESPAARRGLFGAAALGMVLHLSLDALNVYGVHPFYPFDPNWLYGDLVFIIEPVFWIAFGVALALLAPSRMSLFVPLALLVAAPLVFAWQGFLQWGSVILLAGIGVVVGFASRRGGAYGLLTALAVSLAFIGAQAIGGHLARERIRAELARIEPGSRVLDLPLSSFPANSLCWSFATVTETPGNGAGNDAGNGGYAIRVGVLSLAPALAPVSSCPARFGGVAGSERPDLAWKWAERGSVAQLRALRASDCHVDAWLRFARVPSLANGRATDLRFGRPDEPNFSTLPLAASAAQPCPTPVPRWGYPRADLLGMD
jgi:inner membrane protein